MSTGKNKTKPTAGKVDDPRLRNLAIGLKIGRGRMLIGMKNGREISVPFDLYPSLKRATAKQRASWEMIGPGEGFHWPALDLDLSVEGLINGWPERIPKPPVPHPDFVRTRPRKAS